MPMRVAGAALGFIVGSIAAGISAPAHPTDRQACAAFDLHLLTLIEDHGLLNEIEPERLAAAAMQVVAARNACATGDPRTGIQLYELVQLADAHSGCVFAARCAEIFQRWSRRTLPVSRQVTSP